MAVRVIGLRVAILKSPSLSVVLSGVMRGLVVLGSVKIVGVVDARKPTWGHQ
jgi:hypothetical protein